MTLQADRLPEGGETTYSTNIYALYTKHYYSAEDIVDNQAKFWPHSTIEKPKYVCGLADSTLVMHKVKKWRHREVRTGKEHSSGTYLTMEEAKAARLNNFITFNSLDNEESLQVFQVGKLSISERFGEINWVVGSRAGKLRVWLRSRTKQFCRVASYWERCNVEALPLHCIPGPASQGCNSNPLLRQPIFHTIANSCLLILICSIYQETRAYTLESLDSQCLDWYLECSRKCL